MSKNVLLAGESWMSYTTHVKGVDAFYTSVFETGEQWFREAMKSIGYGYTFLPNHLAIDDFPFTVDELKAYDCIVLSDIGANTLLLPTATFARSEIRPDRTKVIRDYVLDGGALLMIGGYLTFSGVDAKGKWHDTAVQDVLPVEILTVDDRMEHCDGVRPVIVKEHEALSGIKGEFPAVLGYNKTIAKPEADVVATVEGDPFIAFGSYGKGKSGIFTTDMAPHWAPPEFCNWEYYTPLFKGIIDYLTK